MITRIKNARLVLSNQIQSGLSLYCENGRISALTADELPFDVEISSCDAYSDYTYNIQGTRGSLRATLTHIEYQYFCENEMPERRLILDSLENEQGEPVYCRETLNWHKEEENLDGTAFDVGTKVYYDMIYNHLVNGAELVIKPEKIRQQIAVM